MPGRLPQMEASDRRDRVAENAARFAAAALAQHFDVVGAVTLGADRGGRARVRRLPVYGLENADERSALARAAFDFAETFEAERDRRERRDPR